MCYSSRILVVLNPRRNMKRAAVDLIAISVFVRLISICLDSCLSPNGQWGSLGRVRFPSSV